MAVIDINLSNIFKIISVSSSLILSAFLVLLSISNSDIKGIIYIASLFTLIIIYFICFATFGEKLVTPTNPICNVFNIPGTSYANSSMNSAVLAFIFVYLAVPMFYNSMNYNILTIVFIFYIIDSVTMLSNECTNGYAILLSTFSPRLFLWQISRPFCITMRLQMRKYVLVLQTKNSNAMCIKMAKF
jgi:hypothetical protein